MKWKGLPKDLDEYQGMIYLITNTVTGKKYIGKKNFWTIRKLPPLKGKKNKRHVKKETDWQTYYGSSEYLSSEIKKYGEESFTRECIALCYNKWQLAYYEGFFQYHCEVLLSDKWYNGLIAVKCHSPKGGYKMKAPVITPIGRKLLLYTMRMDV